MSSRAQENSSLAIRDLKQSPYLRLHMCRGNLTSYTIIFNSLMRWLWLWTERGRVLQLTALVICEIITNTCRVRGGISYSQRLGVMNIAVLAPHARLLCKSNPRLLIPSGVSLFLDVSRLFTWCPIVLAKCQPRGKIHTSECRQARGSARHTCIGAHVSSANESGSLVFFLVPRPSPSACPRFVSPGRNVTA